MLLPAKADKLLAVIKLKMDFLLIGPVNRQNSDVDFKMTKPVFRNSEDRFLINR